MDVFGLGLFLLVGIIGFARTQSDVARLGRGVETAEDFLDTFVKGRFRATRLAIETCL